MQCMNCKIKKKFILALLLFLNSSVPTCWWTRTGSEGGAEEWPKAGYRPEKNKDAVHIEGLTCVVGKKGLTYKGDLMQLVRTRTGWGTWVKAQGGWPHEGVAWCVCQSPSMVTDVATQRGALGRARADEGCTVWHGLWGQLCAGSQSQTRWRRETTQSQAGRRGSRLTWSVQNQVMWKGIHRGKSGWGKDWPQTNRIMGAWFPHQEREELQILQKWALWRWTGMRGTYGVNSWFTTRL